MKYCVGQRVNIRKNLTIQEVNEHIGIDYDDYLEFISCDYFVIDSIVNEYAGINFYVLGSKNDLYEHGWYMDEYCTTLNRKEKLERILSYEI